MPVVKELCLEHLRTFDKSRYIEQIAAEMNGILPDLDIQKIESAALHYVSSHSARGKSSIVRNPEILPKLFKHLTLQILNFTFVSWIIKKIPYDVMLIFCLFSLH